LKPDNILVNLIGRVKICDFGHAKIYKKDKFSTPYVTSVCYRAPEMYFCYPYYDYKVDIFAIGCIFGELFKLRQIFLPQNEKYIIPEMLFLLGNFPENYLDRFNIHQNIKNFFNKINMTKIRGCNFPVYLNTHSLYDKKDINLAVDLLKKMLSWEWEKRPSAKEALEHDFFKS
jgi:serine/threonine protein kinase